MVTIDYRYNSFLRTKAQPRIRFSAEFEKVLFHLGFFFEQRPKMARKKTTSLSFFRFHDFRRLPRKNTSRENNSREGTRPTLPNEAYSTPAVGSTPGKGDGCAALQYLC